MNERIKELAEQAEEWVCKRYPGTMDDNDEFHAQTMHKFAELIVQECAKAADSIAPSIVSDVIKEHFGVE